jgi:predicted GNAT family N-acyltransferase
MAREIVTSENRDEYIAKKMAEKAGKSVEDKEDELKSLANKYRKEHNIDADVWDGKYAIELSKVVVPKENRGEGIGSKFMEDLASHADKKGRRIVLSPSKDFGASSVDRLKSFYKKYGFVENKGKNKDFSISHSMYRNPAKNEKQ